MWKWEKKRHSLGRHEKDKIMEEKLTDDFVKLSKADPKERDPPRSLYRQDDGVTQLPSQPAD